MASRFPFESHNHTGQRQPQQQPGQQSQHQQISAQMRAAPLGFHGGSFEESILLQQQQRQQDIQRDFRLRQILLQEHMEHQSQFGQLGSIMQEHQMRAIGGHLHDYPADLQHHYHTLLLSEQLQRQEERALLEAQAEMRYQEELMLHQQMQAQQQQEEAHGLAQAHSEEAAALGHPAQPQSVPSSVARLRNLAADSLAGNAVKKSDSDRKKSATEASTSSPSRKTDAPMESDVEVVATKRPATETTERPNKQKTQKTKQSPKSKAKSKSPSRSPSSSRTSISGKPPPASVHVPSHEALEHVGARPDAPGLKRSSVYMNKPDPQSNSTETPRTTLKSQTTKLSSKAKRKDLVKATPRHAAKRDAMLTPYSGYSSSPLAIPTPSTVPDHKTVVNSTFVETPRASVPPSASSMRLSHRDLGYESGYYGGNEEDISRKGTVEGLLVAAEAERKEKAIAGTLRGLKSVTWPDSENESDRPRIQEVITTRKAKMFVFSNGFVSELPQLPEEPLYDGPMPAVEYDDGSDDLLADSQHSGSGDGATLEKSDEVGKGRQNTRVVSNVLEYPYPIDVWWPQNSDIKHERQVCGEESDEDIFEDDPTLALKNPALRANMPKIRRRLKQELRPGVLEKLPHCRLHRLSMRRKKNLSVPDLVYCWQVTDMYPNETMVCCSMCGTWRHAACGGHHEPFTIRQNVETPFVAVCDFCHDEKKILADFPNAQKRLERQRMEQIRRGLATSAVMRHASFAKHGGTYKWPLGRVSATHITGHTRSVHSRHDKAERQWADMVKKLGSGYGSRPRERARVRTKELERLLVSVEDAEAYTDRHNIYLFLMRDTSREHPVGFEKERINIFDPEEDSFFGKETSKSEVKRNTQKGGNGVHTSNGEGGLLSEEASREELPAEGATGPDENEDGDDVEGVEEGPHQSSCVRKGCNQKPRFDSLFCSDACGIAALESDLLRSIEESSDIHPALLRN